MTQYLIKLILTSGIIVLVSEVSKRNTFLGGLLASLPLVSYLSMLWLYAETKDLQRVTNFSTRVFWLVLPSLTLFVLFPSFYLSPA